VLSIHKAEWKVSDTGSAHWAFSLWLLLFPRYKGVKVVPTPKIFISNPHFFFFLLGVQCPYKISCLHFSNRFALAPCGFWDKGVFKESQEGSTPKMFTFFLISSQICMQFFSLNFFEKFLSEVWQHVCCSSHCFQDMKGPNRTNAQNFNSFSLDSFWNFLHRIFKQIWLIFNVF